MLKEAYDMLGAFKDIHDGECFSVSNSTMSGNFDFCSVENSPKRICEEEFFDPTYDQENPFASNLTLNLMRNTSAEFPTTHFLDFNVPHVSVDVSADTNAPSLDDFAFVFSRNESSFNPLQAERFTGKIAPCEENAVVQFESKPKKIERKRIQKAPRQQQPPKQTKKKSKKRSSGKRSKSLKKKKDSKKNFQKNQVDDFKRESKNVVKNYGKAMAAFALNDIAIPYLQVLVSDHGVTLEEFRNFMINRKETIDSIGSLRDLLSSDYENNDPQELRFKSIFRKISEVFVRDFAVNWIFTSKSQYKSALLNYRYKMLRRVMDPASFTYLKSQ